jgi:hypothetical protein
VEIDYWKLRERDIVTKLAPAIKNGDLYIGPNGQIRCPRPEAYDPITPWVAIRPGAKNCSFNAEILFNIFEILPSDCYNCWKVVVRPTTLRQMFQLHDLMVEMNRYSKIGIEVRNEVRGFYGAYFYNESIEQGLECLVAMRRAVAERIDPAIKVFLKRGCTEMERKLGASNEWNEDMMDLVIENALRDAIHIDAGFKQPKIIRDKTFMWWVEWAWANDDPTVDEFLGGKPLHDPYVTYEPGPAPDEEETIVAEPGGPKWMDMSKGAQACPAGEIR